MPELKKLLYVDDEEMNLFLFKSLLAQNFDIVTANSPEKALRILEENDSLDLIISDMKMPGMNGLEFITKAQEFYKECPYIILSGYHKIPEIEEALETKKICRYLQKPYEVNEITQSIIKEIELFQTVNKSK